jgi:signal transduction histidine kinase
MDLQNDEWVSDLEEEYPESLDFISMGSMFADSERIELEGSIDRTTEEIWCGGMNGICRARTINGDPVMIRLNSGLVVPLVKGERTIGTLSLFTTREGELSTYGNDSSMMSIWKSIGNVLGRIIERDNLRSELMRTRELLDSTEDLLVLWKSSGAFWEIECNSKAERFIIRKDLSPEMMEGPFFAPPGREWERGMFAWKKAFEEGQTYQLDLELETLEGISVPFLCTFSPYMVEEEVSGVKMTGIETDVIDKAVTSMGSSNKGHRLLLSLISHDLKNPLSAISGYAELLNMTSNEKKELYISKITSLTSRMARTLEQAQFLSRVQDGKIENEFHKVDISGILRSSIKDLHPHTSRYDIHFDPGNEAFEISGHDFLQQAFTNILENAMKYSDDGSRIDIDISADLNGLKVGISDQGRGVPDEYKENIFNYYVSGHSLHDGNGPGVGLAISRSIIDLHGGSIWVEDNHPRGSVFNISLPWSQ